MNQTEYNEEIDLMKYCKVIYKNKHIVTWFLVLGIIFGYIINVLPIYNYRAKALIKVAIVDGVLVELASQTTEKIKNGFYKGYPSLSSEYISQDLIHIWSDDKDKERAKKITNEVAEIIVKEQNDLIAKAKKAKEDNIEKTRNTMNYFISRGQEAALFQVKIISIEEEINKLKQAELLGDISVSYKRLSLQLGLILGAFLGLIAGIFYIFFKDWWVRNKKEFNA